MSAPTARQRLRARRRRRPGDRRRAEGGAGDRRRVHARTPSTASIARWACRRPGCRGSCFLLGLFGARDDDDLSVLGVGRELADQRRRQAVELAGRHSCRSSSRSRCSAAASARSLLLLLVAGLRPGRSRRCPTCASPTIASRSCCAQTGAGVQPRRRRSAARRRFIAVRIEERGRRSPDGQGAHHRARGGAGGVDRPQHRRPRGGR